MPLSRRQFVAGSAAAIILPRARAGEANPWRFDAGNPVIRPGQLNPPYDNLMAGSPCVLRVGDTLRMYYWGQGADSFYSICMAEAPADDVRGWKGRGSVLPHQADNWYDTRGPAAPMVVSVTSDRWIMYVAGKGGIKREGYLNDVVLGAESRDGGNTWRYLGPDPLVPRDRPYDQGGTASTFVSREGGRFRMWYGAFQYRPETAEPWMRRIVHGRAGGKDIPYLGLGYAESDDGIAWRKPVSHLVVRPREGRVTPVEHWVAKPWIIRAGPEDYRLWVSCIGKTYRVHALRSRDGLDWTWERSNGRPDLDDGTGGEPGIGAPGSFDDKMRAYACYVPIGDQLHCWYTGNAYGATGMGHAVKSWPEA